MKEVKLMTQPGVGLLPPADSRSGSSVLAAAAPKLDGDAAALESQIALLTKRIESIANHLQVPFLFPRVRCRVGFSLELRMCAS